MNVFGYARVSSDMQMEGFSISAQERAIRTYCQLQGWELQHVYIDEGRSARSDDISKRPAFAEMLVEAEAQKVDVIVVHKLDRFARNIVTTLTTLQRLEKAGIGFVSINENMDFTSPIGKAMLAMLAAFAQFYSDNLSAETKKGKAERKKQGLFNGVIPFGATRNAQGIPIPDREPWACSMSNRAEVIPYEGLVQAFELAASGASDREVARYLNEHGHMSSGSRGRNPLSKDSVRVILTNRFYLGELPDEYGGWIPGKHKPMIDEVVFQQAQEWRARRATNRSGGNAGHRVHPFTGLLVCGSCGSPMRKQSNNYYRCSRSSQTEQCDERGMPIDILEAQITRLLGALTFSEDNRVMLEKLIREHFETMVPDLEAQRSGASRLRRIKELFVDGAISIEDYREEAAKLEALAQANRVHELVNTSDLISEALRKLSNLENAWHTQTPREQNDMLASMFSAIYVQDRSVIAILPIPEMAVIMNALFTRRGAHRRDERPSLPPMRSKRGIPAHAIPVKFAITMRKSRYGVSRSRKLTNAQIAMIRLRTGESLRDLADEFGVSHETIRSVRRGV